MSTDLPALPPGLYHFLGRWRPSHPDTVPARLRIARDVYNRIITDPSLTHARTPGSGYGMNALLGLTVDVDDSLEPGVWQVSAADGTLLRDSRSTNPVRP